MEPKKISFGFMKTKKVEKFQVEEEKKDFIECLEEKAIRVVGKDDIEEKVDLIIPMKPNTIITAERMQQIANEVECDINNDHHPKPLMEIDKIPIKLENETLQQMAERELLEAAKKEVKTEDVALTVPIPSNNLIGEKESTLEDYESIPIADFGLAMLRGMGWTPGQEQNKYKHPSLRPKGLGLGADKMLKDKKKTNTKKENDEELMVVKDGFVKLIHGKFSGLYGKVMSLDEDNGRVLVELPMKKETVNVNEYMMEAVTKTEFDQQSRILNAEKYEEYKKSSEQNMQNKSLRHPRTEDKLKRERSRRSSRNDRDISDKNGKSHYNEKSSSPNGRERSYKKMQNQGRYNNESSSDSETETRYERNNKKESRNRSRERVKQRERRYPSTDSLGSETDLKSKYKPSSDSETDKRYKRKNKKEPRNKSKERDKQRERRYQSTDSLSSESDLKSKCKPKEITSSDSDTSNSDNYRKSKKNKRDIDKKRKGKKKKRDRDRSPNYRKHRK